MGRQIHQLGAHAGALGFPARGEGSGRAAPSIVALNGRRLHRALARIFAGVPRRDMAAVARAADRIAVRAGEVLAREGECARQLIVVARGSVAAWRNGSHQVLEAGDHWGGDSLEACGFYDVTLVAASDAEVLVFPVREFAWLARTVPGFPHGRAARGRRGLRTA
jgi:CRP-like cAMP-binding protein